MTETTNNETSKKTLTLTKKLELKKPGESDQVRQSFSHGRSKTVAVEVKRRRIPTPAQEQEEAKIEAAAAAAQPEKQEAAPPAKKEPEKPTRHLSKGEIEARMRALQEAAKYDAVESEERSKRESEEAQWRKEMEDLERQRQEILDREKKGQEAPQEEAKEDESADIIPPQEVKPDTHRPSAPPREPNSDEDEDARRKGGAAKIETKKVVAPTERTKYEQPRKLDRQTITRALSDEGVERSRSLASLRRHRQKQKMSHQDTEATRVLRDVIIPDALTVAELANRMAVRSADVIKSLMKLGMMVTINQVIDADTAELICAEFGHKFKRVSESDIEIGLKGAADEGATLEFRAPVVTVMGHVDHGKTSLLDALRKTDVAAGEAGGITQHIGAYQITLKSGQKITFIDTPGHAAFTEMRARGANVTDIVVLVVAADDGIMEQTVEAINHAKAANVPIIVAINKIDKPDANPDRVRNELLQHELVLEDFGGDIMAVEVSAKMGTGLDKLEETILLQAEVLELKANPNRAGEGVVIEAEIDRGRGTVSTVLIQRGTLKLGDIFVAGSEWGRVRALVDDHGRKIEKATPAMPVEVIGFNGVPSAGDEFFVVEDEARAREVAEYRQRKNRDARAAASARGNMEQMMNRIAAGEIKELPVVIKSDVQGSLEAICASLAKLATDEVAIRVLHGGVGGINESDITLARASNALVIGFNVRANPQARDLARRDNVEIRYYSIIYDVLDELKAGLGGLLAPTVKEKYLGSLEIRQVFTVGKSEKIAGCYVLDGVIKRGAKVRLLRDSVVVHEGTLKSLRRFKDEVKEVRESYECGVVFENYNDIHEKDVVECYEMESVARQL